ncbi:MAG: hypothetical protein OXB88_05815 [Bacteriovoracales bacterium]|nr:hypothetical protein [Bacteriovoracales bacterium]
MLSRKEYCGEGEEFPPEWTGSVQELLDETYSSLCRLEERQFGVYGFIYPDEILLIISLTKKRDPHALPLSLFISADYRGPKRDENLPENLLDVSAFLLEKTLSKVPSEDRYSPLWTECTHLSKTYYFKVSRENIDLALEADRLLRENRDDLGEGHPLDFKGKMQ